MSDCLNVHKSWNAGQRYVPDPVHISVGSCLSDGATRKLIAELKSNTRQNILVLKGWFTTKYFSFPAVKVSLCRMPVIVLKSSNSMATYLNGYSERLIQPLSRKTAFFVFFEVDIHPNEKHLNWNPLVTQTLISTDVNVCLMTISTSWPDRRKQQNLNDSKNIHLQVSELHLFKVARQVVFTIFKHQFSLLTVERISLKY